MADSNSDDELMNRLTSCMSMCFATGLGEDCANCAAGNAPVVCTICNMTFYCNETCKRRHARAHRNFCIKMRIERETAEEEEESESDDDESDSESEDVVHDPVSAGRGRARGKGIAALGLPPVQIKKLLDLATKVDTVTTNSSLDKLQKQISQLIADKKIGSTIREQGASGASLKEMKALQEKMNELEKKTQAVADASRTAGIMTVAAVYTPLLVKDDLEFKKYFQLKGMDMPIDLIKTKMQEEGVSPDMLDTPDAVSPNDAGPEEGAYIPMIVTDDPVFKKYFKLKSMEMPIDQIRMKMEGDGVDPTFLDKPNSMSPNDPGPPLQISAGYVSSG